MQDYLQLCRVSNLPTVWMNTVAGYVLSGGGFLIFKMSLLLLALSMTYCGGMAMNDCIDSRIDALQRPARPIPSGRITVMQGTILYASLFGCSAVAFQAAGGSSTFLAGLILIGLVIIYNLTHNYSALAVIPMAGCRFMIYVISGLAFSGVVRGPLLALATAQFLYLLMLTMIARLEKKKRTRVWRLQPVPVMLAAIPVIDGIALGCMAGAGWIAVGVAGGAATLASQRRIKGD